MKPDTKSAPVRAAYRKGLSAGRRKIQRDANPYLVKNEADKIEDIKGWSRLYAQTWDDGWVDGSGASLLGEQPTIPEV